MVIRPHLYLFKSSTHAFCSVLSTIRMSTAHAIEPLREHFKCINSVYPRDNIERQKVPNDKVSWQVEFPDYKPNDYTSKGVLGQPWADKDVPDDSLKWNQVDKACKVDRTSYNGTYQVVNGFPLNPVGRTGLRGRGSLGRWGPNHAADPIVTRWKRSGSEVVLDAKTKKKILQFVAIRRRDTGEWAIPGGMVDPGELVSATLRREFGEEALNTLEASGAQRAKIERDTEELFAKGIEVYRGYVDDPRNTDNAWMETIAYNFHDDSGTSAGLFKLHAGDDAVGAQWMDINRELNLYASHVYMIKRVAELHDAHW